jgi:polyhydroxyalkanoate synthesis regulator phasin
MFDFLKKTYLFGLGLASLTKERVEEIVDEMVKRGEVAEKDRSKVLDDLLTRAKEEQQKLTGTIKETVKNIVHDMGLPTRDEFLNLKNRVEELEKEHKANQE